MMQKIRSFLWNNKVLIAILFAAIFLRFYNTPLRYGIGGDSARDAFVSAYGARAFQLPLTGPFSSLGPFTFGPWYYYVLIISRWLIPSPFAPWIAMGISSSVFVLIMYLIGKHMFGRTFGIITALLVAFSPAQLSSAKSLTNPHLISLCAGLSILLFLKLFRDPKAASWWWIFFGFILGIGINTHYQMLTFLLLPVFLLIVNLKNIRQLWFSLLGFMVTWIPLLFFDLMNHWYTVKNMTYYLLHGREVMYVPNRWLFYLRDFWPLFLSHTTGIPTPLAVGLMAFSLFILTIMLVKKKIPRSFIFLLILFIIQFFQLRFYWGERYMGYLFYLQPFLFILYTFFFWKIVSWNKIIGVICLIVVIGSAQKAILNELPIDEYHKRAGVDAERIIKAYPGKKFQIYTCKLHNFDQTQAIAYMLYTKGMLDEKGFPIAFGLSKCSYPQTDSNEKAPILFPLALDDDAIEVGIASPSALLEAGWSLISPRSRYDSGVRWWFDERP